MPGGEQMNYPTEREKNLFRKVLTHANNIGDTLLSAEVRQWNIDSTELLEYVMAEADRLNDAVSALIMQQTEEDNSEKDQD
jgi:hypothetical protein